MSGIYIENMSMPQGDQLVVVTSDGVALLINEELITLERSKAVPVPNHGRLIDVDAVTDAAMENILMWEDAGCDRDDYRAFLDNYIADAPTIIPASKESE